MTQTHHQPTTAPTTQLLSPLSTPALPDAGLNNGPSLSFGSGLNALFVSPELLSAAVKRLRERTKQRGGAWDPITAQQAELYARRLNVARWIDPRPALESPCGASLDLLRGALAEAIVVQLVMRQTRTGGFDGMQERMRSLDSFARSVVSGARPSSLLSTLDPRDQQTARELPCAEGTVVLGDPRH